MRATSIPLLMVVGLAGCANNPTIADLSSSQRAKLNTMEVSTGPSSRPYKMLKAVKGVSCQHDAYQPQQITESEAMQGVKLNAVLLDADAVINTTCQTGSGADAVRNCVASIVCGGDAIRYTQ